MRILVIIQSSVEPLYQKCTQVLKDEYNKTIEKYNLPVDVISYVGDAHETHMDNDTLYIACDNKLSINKHRELYKYIYEHPEYTVIAKTNTSTVLNLRLLCKYISSDNFLYDNLHTCACMWDDRCVGDFIVDGKTVRYGNFPIGFLHMTTYDIWKDLYMAYDDVVDALTKNHGTPGKPYDVNDDMIMGVLLIYTNHPCVQMVNYIKLSTREDDCVIRNSWRDETMDDIFSTMCIRCKLDSPSDTYKYREDCEPSILRMACKLYDSHTPTFNDLYGCLIKTGYRFLS